MLVSFGIILNFFMLDRSFFLSLTSPSHPQLDFSPQVPRGNSVFVLWLFGFLVISPAHVKKTLRPRKNPFLSPIRYSFSGYLEGGRRTESLPVRRCPLPSLPCPAAGAWAMRETRPSAPAAVISAAPSLADRSPRCLYLMCRSRTAPFVERQRSSPVCSG